MLITGFVLFAQEAISNFFEHENPDGWIKATVFITAFGYAVMFYFSIWYKNEMAGAELFGGFILFLRKLLKEVMNIPNPIVPAPPAPVIPPAPAGV